MKKFLSFSFLFHLSLGLLVLSHFHSPTHPHRHETKNSNNYVTINLTKPKVEKKTPQPKKKARPQKDVNKKEALLSKSKKESTEQKEIIEEVEKSSSGQISSKDAKIDKDKLLSYKEELYNFIKNKQRYPTMAAKLRQEGEVKVLITIDESGAFKNVKLTNQSQFRSLNSGTLNFLNKIAKFKPLPNNKNKEDFEVSIRYQL